MIDVLTVPLQRFETILAKAIDNTEIPAPVINNALHYALFPGGKRFRPSLVYLCGELLQVETACLDILATAIEFIHCYSLIHDDLPAMDNDDFRRGKLSCHRAFTEATAILAGDGLQALAVEVLLTQLPQYLSLEKVISLTRQIMSASGVAGMVSGQSLDLSELQNSQITVEQLKTIHLLKTGKLIIATITAVIIASNTTPALSVSLQNFAEQLGLVFQMQDDYLDSYAPNVLGKKRSSDKENNKITYASLFSQQQLLQLINAEFEQAYQALAPFGARANHLLAFCKQLQHRISYE